jgi:hypothetical protein
VRGNRLAGRFAVTGTRNGVLVNNQWGNTEGPSALVDQAQGRWQVAGNTAAGALRVLPRTYSEVVAGVDSLAAELAQSDMEGTWAARELLTQARQAVAELSEATSVGTTSVSTVESEVRLHVQGNRAGELVVGAVHPSAADQPGLEGLPVATPHALSVVQVLGNQVEGQLVVNGYARCILAHNVAGRLRVGGDDPNRLLDSNLSLE